MKGSLTKDLALLILRLSGLGLAFAHGWPKIALFISGEGGRFIEGVERLGFPLPLLFAWAAGLSELVGGLMIAFGLLTRLAAIFAAFTMCVAAFFRHRLAQQVLVWAGALEVPEDVLESWGNPERAATYLLVFLALILIGGGRFSLDQLLRRKKS